MVILRRPSAMFLCKASLTYQLLVSVSEASADTCCKDSSLIFSEEFYIKGTLFLSRENFSVVIIIFYWLLAIKKT